MLSINFDTVLERFTIGDLLAEFGIAVKGNRCACPVHGGSHPRSFWFRHNRFRCFACGVRGSMLDLVVLLVSCDRAEAIKYIQRLAAERQAQR